MKRIVLKSGKQRPLLRRHPWIFSGAIKKRDPGIAEGDLVQVVDNQGRVLATGHFQIGSIAVRVLAFEACVVDGEFWRKRIRQAWALRQNLGLVDNPETTVFRLVNAEGDQLPGLIVDYYHDTAVIQAHSVGMHRARHAIAAALQDVLTGRLTGIYDKSSASLPAKAPLESSDGWLWGESGTGLVRENGLQFQVDWATGQKTGYYVDQRENRRLLADYARGRRVLNMFGYTGGFSLYALQGEARHVDTVESSARAMALIQRNMELNFFRSAERHRGIQADGFQFLKEMQGRYDLMVLDPPAFAKHQRALANALTGYTRINTQALAKIAPGGVLFTFSCSQVVAREAFRQAVFTAAARSGRAVRILHQLSQPADHPVSIYHPEGEYLKGLVLQVE